MDTEIYGAWERREYSMSQYKEQTRKEPLSYQIEANTGIHLQGYMSRILYNTKSKVKLSP
jgi:hypothetical protein